MMFKKMSANVDFELFEKSEESYFLKSLRVKMTQYIDEELKERPWCDMLFLTWCR